jgi:glycosyltransferase involved in cell wall biosynthesis
MSATTGTGNFEEPLISVILPVYNGGAYLVSSVVSVLSQSLENFELLILDDCSTDNSWKYIGGVNDNRLTIFKNDTNKGLFYNLNFLIKKCNSPLIKLWAQDDIMYPDCLERFVRFNQEHRGLGFCYSGRDIIDENGIVKKLNFVDNTPAIVSPDLHARIAFFTGSIAGNIANVCINRQALDEVGLFNEQMKISADFDMWVRLAQNHDIGFIADKLIQLRDHEGQLSRKASSYLNHVKEDMQVYRNLLGYVSPGTKNEGKKLLRKYKFNFYCTLMIKAFLRGELKIGYAFFHELSSMDNMFKLSLAFCRYKIAKPAKPNFLK